MTSDGVLEYEACSYWFNVDKFTRGRLIPNMRLFPARHFVLILDNCSIHHSCDVKDFNSSGILILFLPSYSPDYNPIEELFSYVKYSSKLMILLMLLVIHYPYLHFKVYPNLNVDGLTMLDIHNKLLASNLIN